MAKQGKGYQFPDGGKFVAGWWKPDVKPIDEQTAYIVRDTYVEHYGFHQGPFIPSQYGLMRKTYPMEDRNPYGRK